MLPMFQNRISKYFIVCLIVCMMICTSVSVAFAAENAAPTITVSTAEAEPGETVTLTVALKHNPGITTTDLKISYNSSAMSILSVKNGTLLGGYIGGQSLSDNPYYCGWMNSLQTSNCAVDGTLATVQFKLDDNITSGTYAVNVIGTGGTDVVTAYNTNLEEIKFTIFSGSIIVKGNGQGETVPTPTPTPTPNPPVQGGTIVPVVPADPVIPEDNTTENEGDDKVDEEPQLTEEEKAAIKKQEKLIKRFEAMTVKISSAKYSKSKNRVTLKYKKTDSGLKCPKYQIYRSTKKNSGYKKIYTTSKTTFTNKTIKKSVKAYYYKIRGIRDFNGKTYYTKWSKKVKVTIK